MTLTILKCFEQFCDSLCPHPCSELLLFHSKTYLQILHHRNITIDLPVFPPRVSFFNFKCFFSDHGIVHLREGWGGVLPKTNHRCRVRKNQDKKEEKY